MPWLESTKEKDRKKETRSFAYLVLLTSSAAAPRPGQPWLAGWHAVRRHAQRAIGCCGQLLLLLLGDGCAAVVAAAETLLVHLQLLRLPLPLRCLLPSLYTAAYVWLAAKLLKAEESTFSSRVQILIKGGLPYLSCVWCMM